MSKISTLSPSKTLLLNKVFAVTILATLFLGIYGNSIGQVVKTESFDGTQFPPLGWIGGKLSGVDPNNYTERAVVGVPAGTPAPQAGAGMCRYRCGSMFLPGEQFFMASPRYDLTNNPGTATVSFWMYKDNINALKDSVTLYINSTPAVNGTRVKVMGPISRDTIGFNGWRQYTAVIPPGFNTTSAYLVFVFTNRQTSGAGPNLYIDNVSIQTYPKPAVFVSSAISYQETADVGKGQNDQLVIGIKIVVDGAGGFGNDSLRLDSIVTNANGSSNIALDIVSPSAKCWYTKGTNAFIMVPGVNQYGGTLTPTFIRDKFTQANFFLENGENYFWITYSTRPSPFAVSGDCIDADFLGAYYRWATYLGADTSRGPTLSSMVGCRQIDVSLCNGIIPTLSVGTSWLSGSYTNNDFVQRVFLGGARYWPVSTPAYPWIDNNINAVGPFGLVYSTPFTVHPPDYEQLPVVSTSVTQPHTTAVLVQGTNYPAPVIVAGNPTNAGGIALQVGTWSSSNYITAWIDYNKDGDLMDAQEQLMAPVSLNANQWTCWGVNVPNVMGSSTANIGSAGPAGIVYGNVKMRVREVFATSVINPCQSGYTFGETEDFIVTIIPTCPAGVKLWLGYTDDWGTPANWCGGVPTIADIALIDEVGFLGGTQIGAPFDPVIHSGTIATAKTIRLSATDTLKINAPSGSSLTIADSLSISYNGAGAKMIVNSAFSDTAQIANGTNPTLVTPFMGNKRNGRMQMVFTKNDLQSHGLIAGDYIDQFLFHIRLRAAPTPVVSYSGFTIKYATVDSMWAGWPVGLPTILAPNTSPYMTLFGPAAVALPMAAGTGGDLTINLTNKMYWNGVSNLVVEICFDNSIVANGSNVDQMWQTQVPTPGYNCTMWLNNNGSPNVPGCTLNWPISGSTAAVGTQFRPNITFRYVRPYTKYPINILGSGVTTAGRWVNNGTFTAGYSNVTFNNASQNQTIGGTSITTFNDLTVNKSGALGTNGVIMGLNVNVDTSLVLTAGYLNLNQYTLNINYSLPMGITRTNGYILSETVSPTYSTVNWNIGTNTSLHTFPFGTATGYYIPVDFTKTTPADNVGIVSIATYKTTPANTPWAGIAGPFTTSVIHMNSQSTGTDISMTDVIDRFWQINKSVVGPINANLKLSYQPGLPVAGEEPAGGPFTYVAQRFQVPGGTGSALGGWYNHPGTSIAGSVSATVNSPISGPWTLGNQSNPLPIQLINFDAKIVKDKVQVWWSTASEVDNDHFVVERTLDGNEFSFIDKVYSQGPSSKIQNYETYDYSPVEGLQYYRLKTVDIQGGHEYSKLVPVRFGKDGLFNIDYITPTSSANSIDVVFTYDSSEPYTYSVVDILGRTLVSRSNNAGYEGIHRITIPVNMNHGIYFVMIENTQKKVASKFVY